MSDRIKIKEEAIDGIIPCTNHVLVRVNVIDGKKNGLYVANTEWDNSGETVTRFGTVVSTPRKLYHRTQRQEFGLEWDAKMELQVGDTAYWGIMQGTDCPMISVGEDTFFLVDYSEIRVIVREEQIIPINGFVVVEEFTEVIKSDFLIIPTICQHANHKMGVVKYVGNRNTTYFNGEQDTCDPEKLNVGDTVLLELRCWTALEDDRFASLEKNLGYVQGRWIIAKIN